MTDIIIETWVILERGVPVKKYEMAQGEFLDLSAHQHKETVLYDPAVHVIRDKPYIPKYIGKKEFLFELFTVAERNALDRHLNILPVMANWSVEMPNTTEGLYRALSQAKQNLDAIERVEIGHPDSMQFLTLCGYLGVFGSDPTIQMTRIADILAAKRPDGTYIND